ncbi:MAG: metal ABC transporter ATP-binding protein [Acholeplasmatales bacterium]|nr:metal ABC transporter ATP-binding protein [Acholeplasmatales bacterium]
MLIDVKNLTLGYEKENVIENVSFTVNKGDFIIIVGANGAGKSTLIKGILGLIPIYSGDIIFDDSLKRNEIGYMPQETKVDSSFPASVSEIVLSGTLARNKFKLFYNKKDKEDATNALKILNIYDIKNKSFQDLSGGQRQKVLLARSLCATNKLLILDEPSNNLDSKSREEFYLLLMKLNKELGITIMMISHDTDIDKMVGNKLLIIKDKGSEFINIEEDM